MEIRFKGTGTLHCVVFEEKVGRPSLVPLLVIRSNSQKSLENEINLIIPKSLSCTIRPIHRYKDRLRVPNFYSKSVLTNKKYVYIYSKKFETL